MKLLLIISLIVFCLADAISWEKTYDSGEPGADVGYSAIETPDHGFIVTGRGNLEYVWLFKVDSAGEILWSKMFQVGDHYGSYGLSIQDVPGEGFAVVVWAWKPTIGEIVYLVRVNDNGDSLWTKGYQVENTRTAGASFAVMPDGGYVILANAFRGSGEYFHFYPCLIRLNANGDTLWTRVYDIPESEGRNIILTEDKGFIIVGTTPQGPGIMTNFFVLRLDSLGNFLWGRVYGRDGPDYTPAIVSDPDGGYTISGTSVDDPYVSTDREDVYILKIDESGDPLWRKIYCNLEYPGVDYATCITSTHDSGYAVAGWTGNYSYSCKVLLLRLDQRGDTLWTKKFWDSDGLNLCSSIIQTSDGGFLIIGSSHADVYLIKTDSLGEALWVREIPQKPQSIFLNAYPTPFNSSCIISAPAGSDVEIYDVNGRLVWSSSIYGASGNIQRSDSSPRSIVWTPDESVRSGVYFVKATLGGQTMIKRVVLMR